MDIVMRDNRVRESGQLATNRQIKLIQEGLARFMETCDPAHPTPLRTFVQPCAPKMSTPITPSGAPTRYCSELSFACPVNQTTPVEPTCGVMSLFPHVQHLTSSIGVWRRLGFGVRAPKVVILYIMICLSLLTIGKLSFQEQASCRSWILRPEYYKLRPWLKARPGI